MGTRADFYVGRGPDAEWLGSVAWDGYPDSFDTILATTTESDYRAAVEAEFAEREDATRPAQGWPWPWDNSGTTDYAYSLHEGKVWASSFGGNWFDPLQELSDGEDEERCTEHAAILPDMSARKSMTLGKRSGLVVVTA